MIDLVPPGKIKWLLLNKKQNKKLRVIGQPDLVVVTPTCSTGGFDPSRPRWAGELWPWAQEHPPLPRGWSWGPMSCPLHRQRVLWIQGHESDNRSQSMGIIGRKKLSFLFFNNSQGFWERPIVIQETHKTTYLIWLLRSLGSLKQGFAK